MLIKSFKFNIKLTRGKKRLYSIIFYFRKFIAPELNYDIYDKELLAIVDSFKV